VPEPHEFAIAIVGLLGALIFARRRQARRCE
jgi:PGF-CTERM protein